MRSHVAKAVIAAPIVAVLATGAAVSYGLKLTAAALAGLVLIALAGVAARALRRGADQADQILDDEIGGAGEHKGLGPKDLPHPTDDKDLP